MLVTHQKKTPGRGVFAFNTSTCNVFRSYFGNSRWDHTSKKNEIYSEIYKFSLETLEKILLRKQHNFRREGYYYLNFVGKLTIE